MRSAPPPQSESPAPAPATAEAFFSAAFRKRLEALDFVAQKVFAGALAGEHRSASRLARGTLFREYRPMAPGDDLRYVDWNVFARLRVPYVKEFEPEEDLEVALFIDASPSMAFGDPDKFAYAREVAAALAFVALRRLESVRIVPCGPAVAPRSFHGSADVARAFRFVAGLSAGKGSLPIDALRIAASGSRARGLAVLLSDFYDERGTEKALAMLAQMRYRVFVIHVVSPEEVAPDYRGRVLLRDAESLREIAFDSSDEILRAYREAFSRHCDAIERACRRREAGYARLVTSDPFESALVRLVRTRHLLR